MYKANFNSLEFKKQKKIFNYQAIIESGLIEFLEDELMPKSIVLFGSFQKGDDVEDSDIDLFEVYAVPTADILSGDITSGKTLGCGSQNRVGNCDIVVHDIGKVVDMVIKGNVNFGEPAGTNFFTDKKHRRFVPFTFANYNRSIELNYIKSYSLMIFLMNNTFERFSDNRE